VAVQPVWWPLMAIVLRRATKADAKYIALLLAELGYPSKEPDVSRRLDRFLRGNPSCFLVAQLGNEVIGLITAELVPYFPNGSTICRITSLIVSSDHRSRGIGEKLVGGAADFAREHHCSGIEITTAEHRLDAHRFYRRVGFSRTSFRFFQAL
jgi:ribosomal protein S18 acetylase RimI-like enzyme